MRKSDETAKPLFARQASGLRREFSAHDVFVFNVLGYALGLVLLITPTFLGGLYPSASIYAVLTFGVVLSIFNGLTYGLFAAAMPRSGGDYNFIGRTLDHGLGFTANWGFTWSQFLGIGVYAGWCVSDALGPAIAAFGFATANSRLVSLGDSVTQPFYVWLIGSLLLLTVAIISIAGLKVLKKFLTLFFYIALMGTLCMAFLFLTSSMETFGERYGAFLEDNFGFVGGVNAVIALAAEKGFPTQHGTSLLAAILALPVGYWVFIGFTYSVYVGGEVREPQRSQSLGIIGSLIFGYVMYMVTLGGYYSVVTRELNNALAFLAGSDSSAVPSIGSSMLLFASLLTDSVVVNFLMSVSSFLWFYLLLFVMLQICVRNIFAWAFDRLLPEKFTEVSRNGAPWYATIIVILIAEFFLTLHCFVGLPFVNYIALFSVCFLICGVAAIAFPYRRKTLYQQSPPLVRRSLFKTPLLVIAGVGNVVLFTIVLYSSLTNPGVSGVEGLLPTFVVIGIYTAGALLYWIIRRSKREEIDFELMYEQIPPE